MNSINKFSIAFVLFQLFQIQISAQSRVRVDNTLWHLSENASIRCIIEFTHKADVSSVNNGFSKFEKGKYVYEKLHQVLNQQQRTKLYLQEKNRSFKSFYIINAIATELTQNEIIDLLMFDEIKFIHYDEPIKAESAMRMQSIANRNFNGVTWGIDTIKADEVWQMGYSGQNTVIAGQDTGYDFLHPAINNTYRGKNTDGTYTHAYNWHDAIHTRHPLNDPATQNPCGFDSQQPCDDHGHGTHTMGTMAGSVDDANTAIGVAPNAKWIACRNMDEGWGLPSTYIECFEFFLAPTDLNNQNPDVTKAPHVINNSWGCPDQEGCNTSNFEMMRQVYQNLRSAGIVVVQSNGNSGPNCNTTDTPGAFFDEAFSVGSTDPDDGISAFSSRGASTFNAHVKPNVSAPGANVRSCVPNNGYANYWGTSMAGPHVAGVVSLIISANPSLEGNVDRIEDIIEQTAVRKTDTTACGGVSGSSIPNNTFGFGRIDAKSAVLLALQPNGITNTENTNEASVVYVSSNQIQIKSNSFQKPFIIQIWNANGKLIESKMINNNATNVDISNYSKGVYFIMASVDFKDKLFVKR